MFIVLPSTSTSARTRTVSPSILVLAGFGASLVPHNSCCYPPPFLSGTVRNGRFIGALDPHKPDLVAHAVCDEMGPRWTCPTWQSACGDSHLDAGSELGMWRPRRRPMVRRLCYIHGCLFHLSVTITTTDRLFSLCTDTRITNCSRPQPCILCA
ncbi:hypothetical protein BD413DRAFT_218314 [Trametes elegans]|nr:hypothetical protein BD413DRAFT_218314 [Trametes elegans]